MYTVDKTLQWTRQWRTTKRSKAIVLNTTMGMLFFLILRTSNLSQLYRKIIIFSSFHFLMGDNSVDMIPPALDNGEPNSTMANQIVYSPKETILEGCTQTVPSSCETKWCSIILSVFALVLNVHCQQQMPYVKLNYTD